MTPFSGEHCESTALVNMLRNRGVDLSEPLVFGLGQGLSFLYWHSKQMPAPFLGGRIKPDQLIRNAAAALVHELVESETASPAKAEKELRAALDAGEVVGLKLDRYHLDYAHDSFHFAAHYLACLGYTPDQYTVVETTGLGVQTTSRDSMARARAAKGPMSSRNLSFRLGTSAFDADDLPRACRDAIAATAAGFLNPPISNMGYKGLQKTAKAVRDWCDALDDPAATFAFVAHTIEAGGTGGGFFRALWARFLDEAAELSDEPAFASVADTYRDLSKMWTEIADTLRRADEPPAMRRAAAEVAAILDGLSAAEGSAMSKLADAA